MWLKIDEDYLQYMKTHGDNCIPNQDYGSGKYKPFFKLFSIGSVHYITQINHAQPRHRNMNEMDDFFKLKQGNEIVGVVNLNYMFPVLDKHLITMNEHDIRTVLSMNKTDVQVNNYMERLKVEELEIKSKSIGLHAEILYERQKGNRLDAKLFNRCLDYGDLETKTLQYELDQQFTKEQTFVIATQGLFFVDVDDERYTVTYGDMESIPLLKEVHENGLELAKDIEITQTNTKSM